MHVVGFVQGCQVQVNKKAKQLNAKSLQKMANKLKLKQVECCCFWHFQMINLAKTQCYSWTRH